MSRQVIFAKLASLPWHRVRVVWPFVTIVVVMVLLGNASLDVIWGMRALANAENARSKALAYAVGDLAQYAQTRSEHAFQRFRTEVAAVNSFRDARTALDPTRPDIALAKEKLRAFGTTPDDAEALVDLYRRFRGVGFLTTISALWD